MQKSQAERTRTETVTGGCSEGIPAFKQTVRDNITGMTDFSWIIHYRELL